MKRAEHIKNGIKGLEGLSKSEGGEANAARKDTARQPPRSRGGRVRACACLSLRSDHKAQPPPASSRDGALQGEGSGAVGGSRRSPRERGIEASREGERVHSGAGGASWPRQVEPPNPTPVYFFLFWKGTSSSITTKF